MSEATELARRYNNSPAWEKLCAELQQRVQEQQHEITQLREELAMLRNPARERRHGERRQLSEYVEIDRRLNDRRQEVMREGGFLPVSRHQAILPDAEIGAASFHPNGHVVVVQS